MATIGGVSCTFLRGEIPPLKMRANVWETPGVNGYGAQRLGYGNGEFELTAIYYGATRAAIDLWLASMAALQGTVVSITNDWAVTFNYCLLSEMGPPVVEARDGPSIAGRAELRIKGVRTA